MPRRLTPERMDDPDVSRDDLDASLRFIRRVNRRLGGVAGLLNALERWFPRDGAPQPLTILDVGTGSADIPLAAVRWAESRGVRIEITAIDLHETTLDLARDYLRDQTGAADPAELGVHLVNADARRLTERFQPRSFHVVHAGMFLHHLPEIELLTVLRQMDRLASRGMIWNDLLRTPLARLGVRLLTMGQPEIVKHDARVSVDAGFAASEVREAITRVGWESPVVRTYTLQQRFVATGEKAVIA